MLSIFNVLLFLLQHTLCDSDLNILQHFLDKNMVEFKKSDRDMSNDTTLVSALRNYSNPNSDILSDPATADLILMDSTASCDSGWTKYSVNGYCYKLGAEMTWYEAEEWCASQKAGSHLASIHTQAVAEWIVATFRPSSWLGIGTIDTWIGLRRGCDNVSYIWTDGTDVDFMWWSPGYPRSTVPEKSCATIWDSSLRRLTSSYTPGQFDDVWDCGKNTATPTCQYDPTGSQPVIAYSAEWCTSTTSMSFTSTTTTPTTSTTTSTTTTTTPATTTTTPTTTTTTTTPTTTTIPTTTTKSTTTTTTTTPTTTTRRATTSTTSTPTTTTTLTSTTTITALTTTPEVRSTTTSTTSTIPTTYISPTLTTSTPTTTTLADTPTTTTTTSTFPIISTTTSTTTPAQFDITKCTVPCDSNWVYFDGHCYALIEGSSTFSQAQKACLNFGATLASVDNIEQNEALRKMFNSNLNLLHTSQAWIGFSTFTNWAISQPDKSDGSSFSYCNVFSLSIVNNGENWGFSRGVWNDYPCAKKQQFAICQK